MHAIKQDMSEPKRIRNAIAIRKKIVGASRELFSEDGYQNTTVTRIREKASVSISTFYKHFDSKQSVLLALLEDERETYTPPIKKALEAEIDTPIDYVTSVVEAFLDPLDEPKLKMLWRETIAATIVLSGDPEARSQIKTDNEFYLRQLAHAFDRLDSMDMLKPNAPLETLVSVVESIVAYGWQNFVSERYADRHSFLAHINRQIEKILVPWLI